MAVGWRVRMLGTLRVETEGMAVERFRTRRVGLLLAYLAYYDERSHSREELADMLWPDLDPEHGRRNLRQALSSLRHHLEPAGTTAGSVLDAQQSRVRLNPQGIGSDVAEFRQAVRSGRAAQAVELYRGELLPGYYEDWVQNERLRLEDEYVTALKGCLDRAEAEGQLDEAIRYARMALAKDDLNEALHERLVRLYAASGSPSRAAGHLAEWRRRCEAELGYTPSPGLERRLDAVRTSAKGKAAPVRPEPSPEEGRTAPTVRLPQPLTRFFGRERERALAVTAIDDGETRLLTLTGPAGTGKTRLSLETGRTLAEERGWNVWFVALADVPEGAGLLDAVLAAVRLEGRGEDPYETLEHRFAEGRNLLVLDNLEHIVEAAVEPIAAILDRVPGVSLLATSRQALHLEGERELDLRALPIPPAEEASLVQLAAVPSVGLFVDRARAALPDFALTAHNAAAIGEICRTLDGLPLALEIAAGLVGAFSPGQMVQNLSSRLELLRSRRRDIAPRHRSLRAAIDYSYHLLNPAQQAFFVGLSVFRGGFTIDAAAEVCLEGAGTKGERLRAILELQERSLVQAEEAREGSPARFRLLESYREYADELLEPEAAQALRRRHAEYFLKQPPLPEERDNRLAAVRFFHEKGAVTPCVEMLLAFGSFSAVAQDVVRQLARSPDFALFHPLDQARILRLATDAHVYRSDFEEALRTSIRACEIAEAAGLEEELATGRRKQALVLSYLGRKEESIALSERNLQDGRRRGDLQAVEYAHANIGSNYWALGNFEASRVAHEQALTASMELRGGTAYWPVLYNLALANLDLGRLDEGMEQASEGLRLAQAEDEAFGVSMCLALVSRYHRYRGNLPAALSTSYESMIKRRSVGFLYWTYQAIYAHAVVLEAMGLFAEATTLIAAARSVERVNGREFVVLRARLTEWLGPVEFERAWADGLAMSLDEAFRRASSHR